MTREFHERCAQLALGRVSTPSSAPCDTRLPLRPSSGSAIRRNAHPQTEGPNRPHTAPPTSPRRQTRISNAETGIIKPAVKTDAFNTSKAHDRLRTVKKCDSSADGASGRILIREGTEILLPNALEPEEVVEANPEILAKMRRKATFVSQTPDQSAKKPLCEIGSSSMKLLKPSQKFVCKPANEILDSVEEFSESEVEIVAETDDNAQSTIKGNKASEKTSVKRLVNSVGNAEGSRKDRHKKQHTAISVRSVANKESYVDVESKQCSAISKSRKREQKYGSAKSVASCNRDNANEKPSSKDAALSILQKLTGKRNQGAHRPGQVPAVNKPQRKHKFEATSVVSSHLDKQKYNMSQESNEPKDDKPAGKNLRKKRSGRCVLEQESVHGKDRPYNTTSAPMSLEKYLTGKFPPYEKKDIVCKPKQLAKRESQSAATYKSRVRQDVRRSSAKQCGSRVTKSQLKAMESVEIGIPSDDGKFLDQQSQGTTTDAENPVLCSATKHVRPSIDSNLEHIIKSIDQEMSKRRCTTSTSNKRGVEIQNDLVSSGKDISEMTEYAPEACRKGGASSNTPVNIHPKYEGSPYLKEKCLSQSGKQRRQPGANSAQSHAHSSGASNVQSSAGSTQPETGDVHGLTRSSQHTHCNCDFSYYQSVTLVNYNPVTY